MSLEDPGEGYKNIVTMFLVFVEMTENEWNQILDFSHKDCLFVVINLDNDADIRRDRYEFSISNNSLYSVSFHDVVRLWLEQVRDLSTDLILNTTEIRDLS